MSAHPGAPTHLVPVDEIRTALRQRISESSLRATAREVGMSPTGLRNFVDGSEAFGATVRRARAWFARWALDQGHSDVAEENALEVLLGPVAPSRRDDAIAACRGVLERMRRTQAA